MEPKRKSAFDTVSDVRAVQTFREDPEAALSGSRLASAEADPAADHSRAVMSLAVDSPEKFLELVGYLPHAIQDIFYQYYLLGRTQTQIGELLGMSQTAVWQTLRLGVNGLCAVIAFGGPPSEAHAGPLADEYQKMLAFVTKPENRRELEVRAPEQLGGFDLSVSDSWIDEQFAAWTTDGPASKESSC